MSTTQQSELLSKFIEAKAKGNNRLALEIIDGLLKLHPKTAEYHFEKGKLLQDNIKRPKAALESFKQAVKYRAGEEFYHVRLAACYHLLGKRNDALESLDAALKVNGKYLGALASKAVLLRVQGDYEEALCLANKCYEIDPDFICAIEEQCENLMWLERHEELLTKSEEMLRLESRAAAFFYKGVALSWLGRYRQSQQSFDRCLAELKLKDADQANENLEVKARNFKAANLRLLDRGAEAEELLLAILETNGPVAGTLEQLIFLYIADRELEKAKQALEKLEEVDLKYTNINYLKATLRYCSDDYRQAAEYFSIALRGYLTKTQLEELFIKKATAHEYLGEYGKSIECHNEYQKVIMNSSRSELEKLDLGSEAESTIAYCLSCCGQYEKAEKIVRDVLEVSPENLMALSVRAKLLNHARQYSEAIELADRIIEADTEYSYAYHAKAVGLFGLGKYEESVKYFFKSFESQDINPSRLKRS